MGARPTRRQRLEPRPPTSIESCFDELTDPRVERTRAHRLSDLMTIAVCAVMCGANDGVAVETFGHAKKEVWLRTFLPLPGGIPSHDTFGRVFARLDPTELQRGFFAWIQTVVGKLPPQVVAVDGKTLRRSADRSRGQAALHLVSAWATASGLVLGQEATDAKSNEITAIPSSAPPSVAVRRSPSLHRRALLDCELAHTPPTNSAPG